VNQPAHREADRQLPIGEEIFLDHVGHFVPDPQAASLALTIAGFAPTPVSIQRNPDGTPTGTGNVTAMLTRGYMEVLFKTADTPLGHELDLAIERYAGVHLAAFGVADAARAHQRLGAFGFPLRPLVEMQRPVETEVGPTTAAFTVARLVRGVMPEGRIQMLTHHTEEAVWQRRWLGHPNGATALASVVIAVADVDEAAPRFARFTDRPSATTPSGRVIALDRGRIEIVNTRAFRTLLPEVAVPSLPFIGAYTIVVKSLDAVERLLQRADIRVRRAGPCLVAPFPPELGTGAWLFTESSDASLFG
jgi:hypothetical protein